MQSESFRFRCLLLGDVLERGMAFSCLQTFLRNCRAHEAFFVFLRGRYEAGSDAASAMDAAGMTFRQVAEAESWKPTRTLNAQDGTPLRIGAGSDHLSDL